MRGRRLGRCVRGAGLAAVLLGGCAGRPVRVPCGDLPMMAELADACTADALNQAPRPAALDKWPEGPAVPPGRKAFELPSDLPGADTPPVQRPKVDANTPVAERERIVRELFPAPVPVGPKAARPAGQPVSLAELQQTALANSPAVHRAQDDAQAALGPVIQAGLRPNPTVGYQVDQWHFGLDSGQQGMLFNKVFKFPGKLSLAQMVAGYDYLNAVVAVRRAQVDVIAKVRTAFFAALVAQKGVETNRALVELADETYRLQLKQLVGGEAAGYEPLQLYAQAVQTRNALAQSEAAYRTASKQLAAAIGEPDMPPALVSGRADAVAPAVDVDHAAAAMLDAHTDLLTARNAIRQAEVNLRLQLRQPYPDLQANATLQYDVPAQNMQLGLQLGIQLPVWDRNQGNIHQARWTIARANEDLRARENDLRSQLADAAGRYETNRVAVENYRDKIIPNLTRAYRAMVRRFQEEPAKVAFNDIVVAQQNLAQAMQSYLTALDGQWHALADLAAVTQQDELYPCPPAPAPK
jgi:cobalt-zinc-cadmium efflux system outer membrane protein